MPVVRRRYNYAAVYLSPKVMHNSKALCGNMLDVFTEVGTLIQKQLLGFMSDEELDDHITECSIQHIEALTLDDSGVSGWCECPRDSLVKGAMNDHGVYIVLKDGALVTTGKRTTKPTKPTSSVVSLFKSR